MDFKAPGRFGILIYVDYVSWEFKANPHPPNANPSQEIRPTIVFLQQILQWHWPHDLVMGWGFGMIGSVGFFSTQAVLSKVWVYDLESRRSFSRDLPSRWEPKRDPYHSHTNRRDSKMGVKLQLQKVFGSWRKRMLWVLGDTAPSSKRSLWRGGTNEQSGMRVGILVSEYQLHLRKLICSSKLLATTSRGH